LNDLGDEIELREGDVRNREEIESALEGFRPDVLVNSAAIQERGAVEDMEEDSFSKHMENNYMGTVRAVKSVLDDMVDEGGRIINISSIAGKTGAPFLSAYCASKFAVEGFTDCLRMEMRGTEVEVVLVEPGPIQTGFNERAILHMENFVPGSRFSDEYRSRLDSEKARDDVEVAAEKLVEAVEADRPKTRYTVTREALLVRKLKPFVTDGIWDLLVSKSFS